MALIDVNPSTHGERMTRARYEKILHEDIITSILECLPVKSLSRFKCVSKNWRAMINSPSFIKKFIMKQHGGPLLLVSWSYSPPLGVISFHHPQSAVTCSDIGVPFMSGYSLSSPHKVESCIEDTNIIGPCNGIIGIVFDGYVTLCNPMLMEYKELPYCVVDPREDLVAADPIPDDRYVFFSVAEGLDRASNGDYKVVLIWQIIDHYAHKDRMKGYVFNLSTSTNTWTEIQPRPFIVPRRSPQVFINGACHWHASEDDFQDQFIILSLELSSEDFVELDYPGDISHHTPYLMAFNQCLSFVQLNLQDQIEIWVMNDYGDSGSWTRNFVLEPHLAIHPLVIWENDKWLLAKRKDNGQLISFSLENTEMRTFNVFLGEKSSRFVTYIDSRWVLAKREANDELVSFSVSLDEVMKSVPMMKLG